MSRSRKLNRWYICTSNIMLQSVQLQINFPVFSSSAAGQWCASLYDDVLGCPVLNILYRREDKWPPLAYAAIQNVCRSSESRTLVRSSYPSRTSCRWCEKDIPAIPSVPWTALPPKSVPSDVWQSHFCRLRLWNRRDWTLLVFRNRYSPALPQRICRPCLPYLRLLCLLPSSLRGAEGMDSLVSGETSKRER